MQSYRHSLLPAKDKIKIRKLGQVFSAIGCVFYRVGGWDDLQIDLHVSLHEGLKIQFAGIVSVFLFNGVNWPDVLGCGTTLERKSTTKFVESMHAFIPTSKK